MKQRIHHPWLMIAALALVFALVGCESSPEPVPVVTSPTEAVTEPAEAMTEPTEAVIESTEATMQEETETEPAESETEPVAVNPDSLYLPVIEQYLQDYPLLPLPSYIGSDSFPREGALLDLDGDGSDELLMIYSRREMIGFEGEYQMADGYCYITAYRLVDGVPQQMMEPVELLDYFYGYHAGIGLGSYEGSPCLVIRLNFGQSDEEYTSYSLLDATTFRLIRNAIKATVYGHLSDEVEEVFYAQRPETTISIVSASDPAIDAAEYEAVEAVMETVLWENDTEVSDSPFMDLEELCASLAG